MRRLHLIFASMLLVLLLAVPASLPQTVMFPGPGMSTATAPPWVPTGTAAWYKAYAITGLTDGQSVASWPDSSGNSYTATAAGAAQPTYKVNIQNSLPIVRFSGSNYMTATVTLSQPLTVFLVGDTTSTAANDFLDGLSYYYMDVQVGSATSLYIGAGGFTCAAVSNLETFSVLMGLFNSPSSYVGSNGTLSSALNPGTNGTGGQVLLGGYTGYHLQGDLGEVVIYSSAVDTNLRQCMEGYLAWTWGLQGKLPSGHPYKSAAPTTASNCT